MILLIKLNNYRKCRLWINEIGELIYTKAINVIERTIPSSGIKLTGIDQIAFELSLPKNNSNYALVGFEFRPDYNNQDTTKITLPVSSAQMRCSMIVLSKPNDRVFIGISEEYGQDVMDSAVKVLNDIGFPPGEIILNLGAYAECGSSKIIFAQTTRILLKLVKLDLLNMTEVEIQNKVELVVSEEII